MRDDRQTVTEYTTNLLAILTLGIHPRRDTAWSNAHGPANSASWLALAVTEHRVGRADTFGTLTDVAFTTLKAARVSGRADRDCIGGILAVAAERSDLGAYT